MPSKKVQGESAFTFVCDPGAIQIEALTEGEGAADGKPRLPRFSMVAYTGGPMRIAGWRYPVIVDLAGLAIPSQSRPIRFGHDMASGVGHTDAIKIEDGKLVATGLVSRDTGAAREIVVSARNGFPWQASIGSTVEEFEFVKENQKVIVNGREFAGPLNVVRKATLGEISFVDLGADGATSASVAAVASGLTKENSAMDNPLETAPETQATEPTEVQAAAAPAVSPPPVDDDANPVVSMCNAEFMVHAHRFRKLGCPIVWVNCMTFMFEHEKRFFAEHGPADAFVFQSEFQRREIEPQLAPFGYKPAAGHLIRGAFDLDEWEFRPRPHAKGEVFVVGRVARPDADKWSSNTWPIYQRIQYANKRALMLGMNERTHQKLGTPPAWADCLKPMAMPVQEYFRRLHCLLPINGGARENWPRAGLEAMAAGVPIVAQNLWGWPEMIEHGETGFLGNCDEELAHYTAMLAYDEDLRIAIAQRAHRRLVEVLANATTIWGGWQRLFASLGSER